MKKKPPSPRSTLRQPSRQLMRQLLALATSAKRAFGLLIAVLLTVSAPSALAQFVWLNEKGVKQYSDMPPPTSVPRSRILKSPNVVSSPAANELAVPPAADVAAPASSTAATGAKRATPLTTAERNADYTKRKMDEAEQAKKTADASKLAADKKANCERARSYSRSLEDGTRIANTDKNGERSYLTDEQRAQEVRNAQRVIADCK